MFVIFEALGVYEKYEGESIHRKRMETWQRASFMEQEGEEELKQEMKKA